ncbi:hypothetical protein DH2020_022450 [Rehmannia glutinosa]|uniref:WEB family protein n=1 Tax=Rehmannia glutinosa TaxID=99300 RepID=A0ABR0WHL5_REHGL
MAETTESSAITETKKVINPRVEIDTSPPFESVKEAVDRFGGSGPWIPHHLLRLAAAGHDETEVFDAEKIEQHAVQLERDLIKKEQETLNLLKELESAKIFVEGLKVNLMPQSSSFMDLKFENHTTFPDENSTDNLSLCSVLSPGLMFMELNQAKLNLNKTSGDLAVIQASVESLNKKMRRDKLLLERSTKMQIPNSEGLSSFEPKRELTNGPDIAMTICKELSFEAEQFKSMTEASRYEVIKAMTEIERTKNSIKMAEMRLNAAKKMEEAAKAVEAIALAERKAHLDGHDSSGVFSHKPDGITLSFEEYRALSRKARQAEDMKFIDTNAIQRTDEAHRLEVPILEKFEETVGKNTESRDVSENNSTKYKFRNSHPGNRNPPARNENESKDKPMPGFTTTTSIGDILSRKLILQDDVMVGRHVENHSDKQHVSLSQMLREQSRLILHPPKPTADGTVEKQYFVQRKKFGFIQMKQNKKKTQPLNVR